MHPVQWFDDELLQAFMDTFYGYGNYQGQYWFVGIEEGGGGSYQDIQNRLIAWDSRGRQELEDVAEYHIAFGVTQFFRPKIRLQPTWNKLSRILLSIEGKPFNLDTVKQYQAYTLARKNSESCLLELLPLPSPNTGHWLYADHSSLPQLKDKWTYMTYIAERRAMQIRQRIQEHKPKAVIFYSVNAWFMQWWKTIAGVSFSEVGVGNARLLVGKDATTTYVITPHPVAYGMTSAYFHNVGRLIAEM